MTGNIPSGQQAGSVTGAAQQMQQPQQQPNPAMMQQQPHPQHHPQSTMGPAGQPIMQQGYQPQGPLHYLEQTTSNIGMPERR